jgi:serine acetyltransferase
MKIIEIIKSDLQSFKSYPDIKCINKNVGILFFIKALLDIDFRAIFMYRVSCALISIGMKKIGILLYYRLKSAHSLDISPYAKVGSGLKIIHAFNIVIGPGVTIGKHCVLFNSITLGNSHPGWKQNDNQKKEMPIIGDRVVLCPGSRIVGSVVLADDVFVGTNSVVLTNIPSCETWAGIPARKISNNKFCE